MARIRLPNNWTPRPYQRAAWDYLENGGKHAELIWHRRSGKDEIALHRTAVAAFERKANYWHMLPEATQARKAIWKAVNPHTGLRRIDEAFPHELRQSTNDTEMLITFKNGSSWQVVGSDNFNSLVGSTPAGIVYSEWALANPSARAYLRPILMENGGWQIFITTPRGKNHAYKTYQAGLKQDGSFAQRLSAVDTGTLTAQQLAEERQNYVDEFGEDMGNALFEQEYMCSFDAAILGAYYGAEFLAIDQQGRITDVPYQPEITVNTAWDLGRTDDTSIWFYQVIRGEIHVIDFHTSSGKDPDFYTDLILSKNYRYGLHYLPHDARAKTLASYGKSIQEIFSKAFGMEKMRIVPDLSLQDGIQASRKALQITWFDTSVEEGTEALRSYQREWDDDKKCFRDTPLHNWTSHPADAYRMLAVAWKEDIKPKAEEKARYPTELTINELLKRQRQKRLGE